MTKKKVPRARAASHRGVGSGRSDCSSSSSNPGPTTPPTTTGQPTPPTPTGNKMTFHHMRRSFPAPGGPITTLHQAAASTGSTPCNVLHDSGHSTPASVTGSSLSANAAAWYPPGHRIPATAPTTTSASMGVVFPASPLAHCEQYPASTGGVSPQSEPHSLPQPDRTHIANLSNLQTTTDNSNKARPSWLSESHEEGEDEGEDVVYEFVPVSDCVAANEAQLIGAMAGLGYWAGTARREETDTEPAEDTRSDDWVDPHGHVYDNRTPPETHHLSGLGEGRGRSTDNVNMTPMSFLAEDLQLGDEDEDDELYDSEMEWVEQELERHAATHADDPTLFW